MRTTIDIEPSLLERVVSATGEKTKSKAIARALEDYLRREAYKELLSLEGTMEFDEDRGIGRERNT